MRHLWGGVLGSFVHLCEDVSEVAAILEEVRGVSLVEPLPVAACDARQYSRQSDCVMQ